MKAFYNAVLVPKVLIDFFLSKKNINHQLVLGYHVHAKKR